MKILVTGKNGQLGRSLKKIEYKYPEHQMVFVSRDEFDISQEEAMRNYCQGNGFDIVINCAAYTAVDKAETEPELADQINHLAVKKLAEICKNENIHLIHISTDYVFNGENYKPYIEADNADPQNVYGITKLKGEQAIQKIDSFGMIIRTSWVYSEFGNNFVKTMLRLGEEKDELSVIYDQVGSPTYAGDLAKAIFQIIRQPAFLEQRLGASVYHYSNEGLASWYDFSKAIFEINQIECLVKPIETKNYPTPAKRPYYGVLNNSSIKHAFDIGIPYWKDSLKVCINQIKV